MNITTKVTESVASAVTSAAKVTVAGVTVAGSNSNQANSVKDTGSTTSVYDDEPTNSPLVWSLAIQILCALLLCVVAHHMWHKTKRSFLRRVESLDRQLIRMEMRLRMQEPNISLISQIAHKCNLQLDDANGEKTRLIQLVMPTNPSETAIGGAKAVDSNTNMLPMDGAEKA